MDSTSGIYKPQHSITQPFNAIVLSLELLDAPIICGSNQSLREETQQISGPTYCDIIASIYFLVRFAHLFPFCPSIELVVCSNKKVVQEISKAPPSIVIEIEQKN